MNLHTHTLATPQDRLSSFALNVAVTLAGVATLVVLGKGIAALGQALALPNACWQLLALRAAAGAAVIGALAYSRWGSFGLFGLLYAGALMLSHSSATVFVSIVAAGLVAAGVSRWLSGSDRPVFRVYAVALTFVGIMSAGSLYSKIARGEGLEGLTAWGFDLGIRFAGAVAAVTLGLLVIRGVRTARIAKV